MEILALLTVVVLLASYNVITVLRDFKVGLKSASMAEAQFYKNVQSMAFHKFYVVKFLSTKLFKKSDWPINR